MDIEIYSNTELRAMRFGHTYCMNLRRNIIEIDWDSGFTFLTLFFSYVAFSVHGIVVLLNVVFIYFPFQGFTRYKSPGRVKGNPCRFTEA